MRILADFVGGHLDGRLEVVPDEAEVIEVPQLGKHTSFDLNLGDMHIGFVEVQMTYYRRDEAPKGMIGDIIVYAFRLDTENDDE